MPVLRPQMPTATQLYPYLVEIDDRKYYSNGGPLASRLEVELSRHIGCSDDTVTTTASATAGLTAALLALELPEGSYCLMPSWTFAATAHSAMAAGLKPWFLDVDRRTWALDPSAVKAALQPVRRRPMALVVVSPFGAPIDIAAWQVFQNETGVPVIVDAAAGFDTVRFSSLISVVSLHATKIFAAGEGGFVVAPNSQICMRVRTAANFGFNGSRIAQGRAINGKMSEYHAAVALASFERWPLTRLRHLQIAGWYRQALKGLPGVSLQPGYGEGWACGVTNVLIESDSAQSISRYLMREGIETRMWWGAGCHVQPAFERCNRQELPATEYMADRVLGLPHFFQMQKTDVALVADTLATALKSRAAGRRRPK